MEGQTIYRVRDFAGLRAGAAKVVDDRGHLLPGYEIAATFSSPNRMNANVVCHIVQNNRSICRKDASRWSRRYASFSLYCDCRSCAKAAGLLRPNADQTQV